MCICIQIRVATTRQRPQHTRSNPTGIQSQKGDATRGERREYNQVEGVGTSLTATSIPRAWTNAFSILLSPYHLFPLYHTILLSLSLNSFNFNSMYIPTISYTFAPWFLGHSLQMLLCDPKVGQMDKNLITGEMNFKFSRYLLLFFFVCNSFVTWNAIVSKYYFVI